MAEHLLESVSVAGRYVLDLYAVEDGGSYINLRYHRPITDARGEVPIAPADVPELLRALAEAAVKLTMYGVLAHEGLPGGGAAEAMPD